MTTPWIPPFICQHLFFFMPMMPLSISLWKLLKSGHTFIWEKCHSLWKFYTNDKRHNKKNTISAMILYRYFIKVRSTRPLTRLLNVCMNSICLILLLYDNSSYPVTFWLWYANYCTNKSEIFLFAFSWWTLSSLAHLFPDVIQSLRLWSTSRCIYV